MKTMKRERMTPSGIAALKNIGWSQTMIGEHYGVSRQAVSEMWRKYKPLTPRQVVLEREFPFKVPSELLQCAPYRRLRDHGEYMATGGKGMTEDELKRLRGFYKMLREKNAVIEYDPDLPPEPGFANCGGWALRERVESDKQLLIRKNEYTTISEYGMTIWSFPKREP